MSKDETTAVNDSGVTQDTSVADSATAETTNPEVADSFEQALNDDLEQVDTKEQPEDKSSENNEEKVDEDKSEEQSQGKAENRKQQLNTEIRDLVSQRNQLKQEVERLNSQVYQPATEQELLDQINPETGEYYNSLEAKVASMEQRQEIERYNNQVAEAQLTLSHEANKALQDFPMFDSESPDFNAELAAEVDQLLGANLVFDQNTGQVIGSHVSPYQLYKTVANSAKSAATRGQVEGQRATEQMLANADVVSSSSQAKSNKDPIMEALQSD